MASCLFCDIQSGKTPTMGGPVYEDELVYAHHFYVEGRKNYLGHLIVETKRHTPDFATLTPVEAQAVGTLIARLSSAIKTCAGAEKVYAEFYGEVTPHLHVNLMARYPGTPEAYLRWNVTDWPDAPRAEADDVAALCERLRATLAAVPS